MLNKLEGLWPSIELLVGPEFKQIEQKRRRWLGYLIVTLLPIAKLFYDLIESVIGK